MIVTKGQHLLEICIARMKIFFKFMNAENYVKQCYLKVISRRFEGLMTDEPFMSFAFSSWVI